MNPISTDWLDALRKLSPEQQVLVMLLIAAIVALGLFALVGRISAMRSDLKKLRAETDKLKTQQETERVKLAAQTDAAQLALTEKTLNLFAGLQSAIADLGGNIKTQTEAYEKLTASVQTGFTSIPTAVHERIAPSIRVLTEDIENVQTQVTAGANITLELLKDQSRQAERLNADITARIEKLPEELRKELTPLFTQIAELGKAIQAHSQQREQEARALQDAFLNLEKRLIDKVADLLNRPGPSVIPSLPEPPTTPPAPLSNLTGILPHPITQ